MKRNRLPLLLLVSLMPACASNRSELLSETKEESVGAEGRRSAERRSTVDFDEDVIEGALTRPEGVGESEGFESLRVVGGEREGQPIFEHYGTNPTIDTAEESTSTFSVDVDTASYAISRAMLRAGRLPDLAAVRVEEFVNSIRYDYPPPEKEPFSVVAEVFPSPYRRGYHLLLLGLKGKVVAAERRPPANLVFVVDTSGSMAAGGRLEMVKAALAVLVDQLREDDTVAVVSYSDMARVVLPAASGAEKQRIKDTLATLHTEGSTNVQAGLMLGYEVAEKARRDGAVTKLILLSDGVANTGFTDAHEIFAAVRGRAREGASLSTIGVGMGNYNDVLLEKLAVQGQGNYAYVDTLAEAKKEFVEKLSGTLVVIAKDVKVQVEMDKAGVERYRLIGFENRVLKNREFHDDRIDAGEIGAGHEVTALYEIKLKPGADRIGWLRLRAKDPRGGASRLVQEELTTRLVRKSIAETSATSRLALVAAGFAEKLRGSYWARTLSYDQIRSLFDGLPGALRARPDVRELGELIVAAQRLDGRGDRFEREQPLATMDWDHLPVVRRSP
jgi:Ca-activated chloride channel family protein